MKLLSQISLLLFLILAACGGEDNSLEGKKAQLAEKRKALEKLKAEIQGLEGEIAKLDPKFKKESAEGEATLVTTIALKPEAFSSYFTVQGSVESDKNVVLTAENAGLVKQILVSEGQRVAAGQLLVSQNVQVLQSQIAEVQKALELAEMVYERQSNLWKQKIGTEIQYLEAKNNKERFERQLQTLSSQMSMSQVYAPFSGVVDEIIVKRGENAGPGSPLLRLVSASQITVVANVSEAYLGKVQKGDKVVVEFPSLDIEREARISLIGETINPENRTFRIEISMPNPDGKLKPDLLATVNIKDYEKDSSVVIPTNLIQRDKAGDYVYILVESEGKNYAKISRIKRGDTYQNRTLIEEGLKGTEVLIDKGFREVNDGGAVKVVEAEKAKKDKVAYQK